ncbi:uncharacterized protein LOC143378481 isoform X2 [Andrena cerasifolii]
MICGVPKLQLGEEVKKLINPYGDVKRIHVVPDYPSEEFTEAYYIQYARIQSSRIAKRFIDGKNFYGGLLHVFYAPELESVSETRAKLIQRRRDAAIRIKRNQQDMTNPSVDKFVPQEQFHRKKKAPALPLTEERLTKHYPGETLYSIYNGIPQHIDPRPVSEPSLPSASYSQEATSISSALLQAPYHPNEDVIKINEARESALKRDSAKGKRKNYKGQAVNSDVKVRVVRPRIVDTATIVKWDTSNKNVFANPKKVESNITIKLISKSDNDSKRIIIKDPSVSQLVKPSKDLKLLIEEAKTQIRAAMQINNTGS